MAGRDQALAFADFLAKLKSASPQTSISGFLFLSCLRLWHVLILVVDPVLGDHSKLYVPVEMKDVYRQHYLSLADVITPNQFEAELLTNIKLVSEMDVVRAIQSLHEEYDLPAVVITSVELNNQSFYLYGSCKIQGKHDFFRIPLQKVQGSFTGTGDLFAALLTGRCPSKKDQQAHWLRTACELAVSTLFAVLQRTRQSAGSDESPRGTELKLIQSKRDIECPDAILFHAETVQVASVNP